MRVCEIVKERNIITKEKQWGEGKGASDHERDVIKDEISRKFVLGDELLYLGDPSDTCVHRFQWRPVLDGDTVPGSNAYPSY